MTIYREPDYEKAQNVAYKTVLSSGLNSLPISITKIIKLYPNLSLMKYTQLAKMHKISIDEVIKLLKSEDGCIIQRDNGMYVIFYNDTVDNKARIRFTLAHELGHFLLKHNEIAGTKMSLRNKIKDEDYIEPNHYDILEKEANYFAKRLLAPLPLIYSYTNHFRRIDAIVIEKIFNVSYSVSKYLIDDLNRRMNQLNIVSETHAMNENFNNYLYLDTNYDICPNCSGFIDCNSNLCIYCGEIHYLNLNYENYLKVKNKRSNYMIYSSIDVDEFGFTSQCPKCNNEIIGHQQNGCQICGTYLRNICLGEGQNMNYEITPSYLEHLNDSYGCSIVLKGDARFCPNCGGVTSFYMQDLLASWQDEFELKNRNSESNVVPINHNYN